MTVDRREHWDKKGKTKREKGYSLSAKKAMPRIVRRLGDDIIYQRRFIGVRLDY
jgi:hypothetical protein